MKIVLQNERPVSWNKFYSGMHWSVRQDEAKRVHELVWATLHSSDDMHTDAMMDGRVDIHITVYFDKRPYDPDNICSKLYVDGLKDNVIENDTRQYVRRVTVQSEIDRENPRVEIEIQEVEECSG